MLTRLRAAPITAPTLLAVAVFLAWTPLDGGQPITRWAPGTLLLLALLVMTVIAVPPRVGDAAACRRGGDGLPRGLHAVELRVDRLGRRSRRRGDGANRTLLYLVVSLLFAGWAQREGTAALILGAWTAAMIGIALVVLMTMPGHDPLGAFQGERLAEPAGYPNAAAAQWMLAFFPAVILASRARVRGARGVRGRRGRARVARAHDPEPRDAVLDADRAGDHVPRRAGPRARARQRSSRSRSACCSRRGRCSTSATASGTRAPDVHGHPEPDRVARRRRARARLPRRRGRRARRRGGGRARALGTCAGRGGAARGPNPRPRLAQRRRARGARRARGCGGPFEATSDAWHSFKRGYEGNDPGNRLTGGLGSNRYDFYRVALALRGPPDRRRRRRQLPPGLPAAPRDATRRPATRTASRCARSPGSASSGRCCCSAVAASRSRGVAARRRAPPLGAAVAGAALTRSRTGSCTGRLRLVLGVRRPRARRPSPCSGWPVRWRRGRVGEADVATPRRSSARRPHRRPRPRRRGARPRRSGDRRPVAGRARRRAGGRRVRAAAVRGLLAPGPRRRPPSRQRPAGADRGLDRAALRRPGPGASRRSQQAVERNPRGQYATLELGAIASVQGDRARGAERCCDGRWRSRRATAPRAGGARGGRGEGGTVDIAALNRRILGAGQHASRKGEISHPRGSLDGRPDAYRTTRVPVVRFNVQLFRHVTMTSALPAPRPC